MMEYMRNGGFMMWVMLIVAIGAGVLAATRKRNDRAGVLFGGAFLSLVLGVFGMALGMIAVSRGVEHFPDKATAGFIGLGELANNGTFGAALATLLGIGGVVSRTPRVQTA